MSEKEFLTMVGSNITSIRKKRGYTINYVAQECDMEKTNLIPIEKGRINATCLTLFKIAKVLEVDVKDFFAK
jgi:transcriptional regulator with XRE-family HTH domain